MNIASVTTDALNNSHASHNIKSFKYNYIVNTPDYNNSTLINLNGSPDNQIFHINTDNNKSNDCLNQDKQQIIKNDADMAYNSEALSDIYIKKELIIDDNDNNDDEANNSNQEDIEVIPDIYIKNEPILDDYDDDDTNNNNQDIQTILYNELQMENESMCPIYKPTTPSKSVHNITPLLFESATSSLVSFTRTSIRKRIYGDEFKEPTLLTVEPKAKIIKIEQPNHQFVLPINNDKQQQYHVIAPPIPQYNVIKQILASTLPSQTTSTQTPTITANEEGSINSNCPQKTISVKLELQNDDNINEQIENSTLNPVKKIYSIAEIQNEPKSTPVPTITKRKYIEKTIVYNNLPTLCSRCFAAKCICSYFN